MTNKKFRRAALAVSALTVGLGGFVAVAPALAADAGTSTADTATTAVGTSEGSGTADESAPAPAAPPEGSTPKPGAVDASTDTSEDNTAVNDSKPKGEEENKPAAAKPADPKGDTGIDVDDLVAKIEKKNKEAFEKLTAARKDCLTVADEVLRDTTNKYSAEQQKKAAGALLFCGYSPKWSKLSIDDQTMKADKYRAKVEALVDAIKNPMKPAPKKDEAVQTDPEMKDETKKDEAVQTDPVIEEKDEANNEPVVTPVEVVKKAPMNKLAKTGSSGLALSLISLLTVAAGAGIVALRRRTI